MEIRRFRPEDTPAVGRLNDRLNTGGASYRVYPEDANLLTDGPVRQRLFVAADGDEIRGAVWLKEHDVRISGTTIRAGWAKYPVSESLVNPTFGSVGGSLIFQLLREQPRLMALGLGGHESAFARMLHGMRWFGGSIPLFLLPVRPARVLRGLEHLRHSWTRRFVLDVLAASGGGWLGLQAARAVGRLRSPRPARNWTVDEVTEFGPWIDRMWESTCDLYPFACTRDAAHLTAQRTEFAKHGDLRWLRVHRGGDDIGWTSVAVRDFRQAPDPDPRFGRLVVATIGDVFTDPRQAGTVVAAAVRHLREREVDLIVSNQAHTVWREALRGEGFVLGPSTFAFYCSPTLVKDIGHGDTVDLTRLHLNRGDCDGPLWL